jgi:beta-lactamase class A
MVMDARTGEVLHSRNADTRLHPASLTKMMTLYIAFEAVRLGEIDLDTQVRISANAAAEPPSKLGLRAGSTIRFRFLIRAAAIRSANDAATAIAEAISGSEAAFARRMNRTATRARHDPDHVPQRPWSDRGRAHVDRARHDASGAAAGLRLSPVLQHLLPAGGRARASRRCATPTGMC